MILPVELAVLKQAGELAFSCGGLPNTTGITGLASSIGGGQASSAHMFTAKYSRCS